MQLRPFRDFAGVRRSSIDFDVWFLLFTNGLSVDGVSFVESFQIFFFSFPAHGSDCSIPFPGRRLFVPSCLPSTYVSPCYFELYPLVCVFAMSRFVCFVVGYPWTGARYTTCVVVDAGDVVVSISPGCPVSLYPTDATSPVQPLKRVHHAPTPREGFPSDDVGRPRPPSLPLCPGGDTWKGRMDPNPSPPHDPTTEREEKERVSLEPHPSLPHEGVWYGGSRAWGGGPGRERCLESGVKANRTDRVPVVPNHPRHLGTIVGRERIEATRRGGQRSNQDRSFRKIDDNVYGPRNPRPKPIQGRREVRSQVGTWHAEDEGKINAIHSSSVVKRKTSTLWLARGPLTWSIP